MRIRDHKVINKDVLSSWLLRRVLKSYTPGLDVHGLAGQPQAVKVLRVSLTRMYRGWKTNNKQFMKLLSDGSLLCSISDSIHSILAVLTPSAIIPFERDERCRITEYTTNSIVLISQIRLKWMPPRQFFSEFGDSVPNFASFSYAVLYIDHVETLDTHQEETMESLESVYQTKGYKKVVRPLDIRIDEEYLCG